jgi:hypothetical protein
MVFGGVTTNFTNKVNYCFGGVENFVSKKTGSPTFGSIAKCFSVLVTFGAVAGSIHYGAKVLMKDGASSTSNTTADVAKEVL